MYLIEDEIYYLEQLKYILEFLPINRNKFLDIGAGDGSLTKCVAKYFISTTVIDIDNNLRQNYVNTNIDFKNIDFLSYKTSEKYDLILCSHVYAHVLPDKRQEFGNKMLSLLNDSSICVMFNHLPLSFVDQLMWDYLPNTSFINSWLLSRRIISIHLYTNDKVLLEKIHKTFKINK